MNKNYREIEFSVGCNVEEAVNKLLNYKERGILACGDFNGHILYSDTVTMNGAYKEIIGKTKAELEKEHQEWKENYSREEIKFKENIPSLSEEWMKKKK